MTNQPFPNPQAEEGRTPEGRDFYAELCTVETLQSAYAHLQENYQAHGLEPCAFETLQAEGVQTFLQQLHSDLQRRTYHPSQMAEAEGQAALRDRVVQVALKRLLQSTFPSAFSGDADAEKTIKWLADHIDKGLCRVYAVHVNESLDDAGQERLVERVSRLISDPQLIEALKETLASPLASPALLAPVLAGIAFAEIDHILQQGKALGREENFHHAQCTRAGNELIVLADSDPRYDWILPAVKTRLGEELSKLHYERAVIESQSLDLSLGHRLRFLDYDLRLVKNRHGDFRVHYRLVEKAKRRQAKKAGARLLGGSHLLRWTQPCLDWLERRRGLRFISSLCCKADAIQVGWRPLPITLLPVLMLRFGWLSPVALLCLGAIPVCNWRWIVHVLLAAYEKGNSIQASWRYLPITLFPVLMLLFGWRSLAPWLDVAAIFACNWHWTLGIVRWVGRRKLDMVAGACAVAALIALSPLLRDIYANRPREEAVSTSLPPGFFLGEYHGASWWNGEPAPGVTYGLYVPPNFQGQKGPFPLIVFLHGAGERTKSRLFKAGLPAVIASHFGTNKPKGHFEFVAFFPIDPTGWWQAGSAEVERVMIALDYVIERHRIDPSRVYLTGHSAGGSGV